METKTVVLDEDGIEHLRKLIDYNWQDELRDFEEHEGEKDCHIFVTLVALDNLVEGTSCEPETYVQIRQLVDKEDDR